MENPLPGPINDRRRRTLTRFTWLALLAYHAPVAVAYLAIPMGVAQYTYGELTLVYLGILFTNLIFLGIIQVWKTVTIPFIKVMLYGQIANSLILMTFKFYVMGNLRYLTLIACLTASIFVFIQSRLLVSFLVISGVVLDYLGVSYVASGFSLMNPYFSKDLLVVMVYVPVSVFIAYMCGILQKQHKEIKATYRELEEAHGSLESYNEHMMESLRYAEVIQRSLLPGIDRLKTESPESLIIWMPKDIVGGDIFYTFTSPGKSIVVMMDCTGHGVPGAFLTLIAYTEIRKIILDGKCYEPAEILKRLNHALKVILHRHSEKHTLSGMDVGVIDVDHRECRVRYSGAQICLFLVTGGRAKRIKSDKHSLGYENSDRDFPFTTHAIDLERGDCLYMKTDGFTDQLGGEKRLRFGNSRFVSMLEDIHPRSFSYQRQEILRRFLGYKGDNDQMDDVTVIGFRM